LHVPSGVTGVSVMPDVGELFITVLIMVGVDVGVFVGVGVLGFLASPLI